MEYGRNSYSLRRILRKITRTLPVLAGIDYFLVHLVERYVANACRNLGTSGHNSISHPHAQFPRNFNLEDVLVSHYCYRHYNQSCPTCHTHGLLEYSCSFCIENTCEQETCGAQWGWLNQLEECRQTIVITETYNTNLDRLQTQFQALISGNGPEYLQSVRNLPINMNSNNMNIINTDSRLRLDPRLSDNIQQNNINDLAYNRVNNRVNLGIEIKESDSNNRLIYSSEDDLLSEEQGARGDLLSSVNSNSNNANSNNVQSLEYYNDNKFPSQNLDYRIYCADPMAELNKATLRCYSQCPINYNKYGVSCFSNCALPQKDDFSTYCIEPEVRKPIELFSSCAEDCNDNNIRDFCFACPEGMHKKDCQCVKSEKIEFREILERSYTNAIMLLIDE